MRAVLCALRRRRLEPEREEYSLAVWRLKAYADAAQGSGGIEVLDLEADQSGEMIDRLLTGPPELLGLSCYVWNVTALASIARRLKEAHPGVVVVAGGPAVDYFLPGSPPHPPGVDFVVRGEGEVVFADLVRALEEDRPPEQVPGLLHIVGDRCEPTGAREPLANLDRLPSPYEAGLLVPRQEVLLEGSRGCPFRCAFCSSPTQFGTRVRRFSPAYLAADLERTRAGGIRRAFVIESTMNQDAGRMGALCEALAATEPDGRLEYFLEIHPDILQEEHFEILSDLPGVLFFGIGLQSLEADVLRTSSRRPHRPDLDEIIGRLSELGEPVVEIMLGLPGETPASFERTLEHVLALDVSVLAFRTIVAPGTELWWRAAELGIDYDPETFLVRSIPGFSADDLDRAEDTCFHLLGEVAEDREGFYGEYSAGDRRVVTFKAERAHDPANLSPVDRERLAGILTAAGIEPHGDATVEPGLIRVPLPGGSASEVATLAPAGRIPEPGARTCFFDVGCTGVEAAPDLCDRLAASVREVEHAYPEDLAPLLRAMAPPPQSITLAEATTPALRRRIRAGAAGRSLRLRLASPSEERRLVDLTRLARVEGYNEVVLEVLNGYPLGGLPAAPLARAGITAIELAVAAEPSLKEELLRDTDALVTAGLPVWLVIVVGKDILEELETLVDEVGRKLPRGVGIRFTLEPTARAPLEVLCSAIAAAARRAEAAATPVRIADDVPLCLVTDLEHLSETFGREPATAGERAREIDCETCRWSPWCSGPHATYLDGSGR